MVNHIVLIRGEDGLLFDPEGNRYNEQGQKLDAAGNVIPEPAVDPAAPNPPPLNQAAPIQPAAFQPALPNEGAGEQRTLGDHNRPDFFYANRSAIRPPPFQRNNFELKPSYYTLVGLHPFHGYPTEKPMDHIENFEDLASSIKADGVSMDYLLCKLFPYSLAGDAAYWLKQLQPGSLTNWEDTKKAFLNNFYDDAMSEEARNNISTFRQGPTEAFKAAWVRFRSYQRDCPHHGFSEIQLLGTFFRGIDWQYQMALDAASNGNFNTRYPHQAYQLIENLASSNSTKNADLERKKLGGNMDRSQIAEVKAKLDSVHGLLVGKKSVQFAAEVESVDEEDVNFINGAGFQGQRWANQQGYNSSYHKPYGSSSYQKPPEQDNEMKSMLKQLLEGQQNMTVSFNGRMDAMYQDLNGKFEALSTHVKKLDVQVAQSAESIKRQEGFLPGKTNINPKHSCHAIMVETGANFVDFEKTATDFRTAEVACRATPLNCVGRHCNSCVSVDASDLPEEILQISDFQANSCKFQTAPDLTETSKSGAERVYKPKIPFPRGPRKSKQEIEDAKVKAMIDKLMIEIPLVDAVNLSLH
ncbi:unnamed protein product [Microthlaspi erraticum]|uniref:Retrotransposon gag domain-containing protein n=1 Tax=Microthlaspi erraticum TaxID=1685480 RepID=A0A6D2IXQ5_9BRAS|nr:unnamed protein product [Microthlaspi erraticum]